MQRRLGGKTLGFNLAALRPTGTPAEIEHATSPLPEPEDLLGFGMIPEFVGRLPVVTACEALTEDELVCVLTEPKNAMVKQYSKLFAMEGAGLTITKDALRALAQQAVKKGTGARALRSILEKLMLDTMYDLPSREDIADVTINRAVVEGRRAPMLRRKQDADAA